MLKLRLKMTIEVALARLTQLERAGHQVRILPHFVGSKFRLKTEPLRRGIPVVLHGSIVPDTGGSLVTVWPLPHWSMVVWLPIWCWFAIALVKAPLWFVAVGIVVGVVSFLVEVYRAYAVIRKAYEA